MKTTLEILFFHKVPSFFSLFYILPFINLSCDTFICYFLYYLCNQIKQIPHFKNNKNTNEISQIRDLNVRMRSKNNFQINGIRETLKRFDDDNDNACLCEDFGRLKTSKKEQLI